jgi:hypothetical protein
MDNAGLVAALAPAFAAGFALQRLLEIVDPIVSRFVGENAKKAALGLLSLAIGLALAFKLELQILGHLGVSLSIYLDYAVTGLVVSAGTEGFNSVLKFLSYKKEEVKVDAVTKKLGAARSFAVANALSRLAGKNLSLPENIINVDEALENSLQQEIKTNWSDKFIASTWKKRVFSEYTDDVDDAKVAVLYATRRVAKFLDIQLDDDVELSLQSHTDLKTTPEDALPLMSEAIGWPAQPA